MIEAIPLLHDYLHLSARRLPDKTALVCQKKRLTYSEIEARSNALAWSLEKNGVQRGDRVIVFADNTVETVIAFWAVLKANAVVSIVNPLTKADKLAYLLDDCRAVAMMTDAHLTRVFADVVKRAKHLRTLIVSGTSDLSQFDTIACVKSWDDAVGEGNTDCPPRRQCIDIDLAAIIYTSGSTGDPKGVMLTHRNMITAATSVSTYLRFAQDEIVMCVLP
ncbi:MAG TPA: AMP-binding protein, partial [Polyangiaceae bacterium]|nr:AMP-binding protein [Polyangiaceae bacterium]